MLRNMPEERKPLHGVTFKKTVILSDNIQQFFRPITAGVITAKTDRYANKEF
jgi:hypothetical protein